MKKLYIILALIIVSILMVFAGDTIKILRIYHNGTFTAIPLVNIDCIDHSKIDVDGKLQANYTSTVIETLDSTYNIHISEIDSVVIGETQIGDALLYEKVSGELYSYISSHEGATIEDIQEQLKKYPSSVTSEVKSNILYVYIDGYVYICDPYKLTSVDYSDVESVGADIEALIMEIDNALYPDKNSTRSLEDYKGSYMNSSFTRSSNSIVTLTKNKILFWDPFIPYRHNFYTNNMTVKGELSDLKNCSNYDIVVLFCHGNPEGRVGIPARFSNEMVKKIHYDRGSSGTGGDTEELLFLTGGMMNMLFPNDLSHTMFFACMCYSDSESSSSKGIRKVLKNKHVLSFAGANNTMDNDVLDFFPEFAEYFYSGGSADQIIKQLFKSSRKTSPVSKIYKTKSGINGIYSFNYDDKIIYKPIVNAMSNVNNQPRAGITLPYELAGNVSAISSSDPNLSVGFLFKNKNTGKETELEIEESTVTIHERYNYKELISRVELLGKTTDLEPGTYEYRTYLDVDGNKTYSDEKYEFAKETMNLCPDGNHPHMIDLGLPSGTKWLCCNIGANAPEIAGGYFAWGETVERSFFTWNNYKYKNPSYSDDYCLPMGNISGTVKDVAYVRSMGQIPIIEDIVELDENCDIIEYVINGVEGKLFTGKNGNKLFIPLIYNENDSHGHCYWLGDESPLYTNGLAYAFSPQGRRLYTQLEIPKYWGCTVRSVVKQTK